MFWGVLFARSPLALPAPSSASLPGAAKLQGCGDRGEDGTRAVGARTDSPGAAVRAPPVPGAVIVAAPPPVDA